MKARSSKVTVQVLLAVLFSFISQITIIESAWGWGKDGHEMVAAVGVQLAGVGSQFWKANLANMVRLTTAPDLLWKQGPTYRPETVTHFFQPDSYFKNPAQFNMIPHDFTQMLAKYGQTTVVNYGTAPWRVNQFYNAAVAALRAQDLRTALVMAGLMSHYIGDMSQPLHMTENYDGQLTNDKGIHKFFETTNIMPNVAQLHSTVPPIAQQLLNDPHFKMQFTGSIVDVGFNELTRAFMYKDQLIHTDLTMGRTGAGAAAQLTLATSRIADGGATLAMVLSHLWQDGGQQDAGATVVMQIPEWIQPSYYNSVLSLQSGQRSGMEVSCFEKSDDCL